MTHERKRQNEMMRTLESSRWAAVRRLRELDKIAELEHKLAALRSPQKGEGKTNEN